MTKAEQARIVGWRLSILHWAGGEHAKQASNPRGDANGIRSRQAALLVISLQSVRMALSAADHHGDYFPCPQA